MEKINIHSEVRQMIADRVGRGDALTVANYVDVAMAEHSDITGNDADFYIICTRNYIKEVVRSNIGRFAPKTSANDSQLVLDGFEHLQVAYTFERRGETVLVPADQATDLELERRAQEYELMAQGCKAHAREIREYIATRRGLAA